MKQNRFFHILGFLHFSDNRNEPDKADENYDMLQKMRTIFDKLSIKDARTVRNKSLQAMLF
jgi:hypothetical protein